MSQQAAATIMVLTNRFSGRGEGWEESYRFTKKGFYVGIRKTHTSCLHHTLLFVYPDYIYRSHLFHSLIIHSRLHWQL